MLKRVLRNNVNKKIKDIYFTYFKTVLLNLVLKLFTEKNKFYRKIKFLFFFNLLKDLQRTKK